MNSNLIIYHHPRCRKSREGLQYLVDHKIPHQVVEYMKTPLSLSDLKNILLKLNKKPSEIVRNQETIFKKELKGRQFTDDEWIKIIIENPPLLVRPIVVAKHKAVIAIPPDKIAGLL